MCNSTKNIQICNAIKSFSHNKTNDKVGKVHIFYK